MGATLNIHSVYRIFQVRFRPKRIKRLRDRFPLIDQPSSTILDVGGTPYWWSDVRPATNAITIVNTDRKLQGDTLQAGYEFAIADGRNLPYASRQFDLAHSNSVIEHVGGLQDQQRFAAELLRCGRSVYIQTPNKWFPVEPHLITMFIHWLPFRVQRRLIRWLSVWGWVQKPTQAEIDDFLRTTRLLSRAEICSMFPDCELWEEKVLGLTKSFVLTRG
jgi:hypothetical protein